MSTTTKIAETGTGVRCGNHGSERVYHWTSADVRACFATPAPDRNWGDMRTTEERQAATVDSGQEARASYLANMVALIRSMLETKAVEPRYATSLVEYLEKGDFTYHGLKTAVSRLDSMPTKTFSVPAGRYAVEIDGVLKFFKVDKPTEGRWKGYTFLKIQASDEYHPIRAKAARDAILCEIAQDPKGAMLRYGVEIGACGHCGRTLTNQDSRDRGIGPVCANKMGW